MKKIVLLLFMFASFATMNAQLLWEITGKDLDKPSYLFGTHHAISTAIVDSIPDLYKSFNRTQAVVGELAIDEQKMVQKMITAASMPYTIDKYLSEDEYQLVDSVMLQYYKFPLKYVENLRPAMISNMISMAQIERLYPKLSENGSLDSFFQNIATELGNPVYGLETIDDQIDILFRSQSIERQAFLLVEQIKSLHEADESYALLTNLYRKGNLEEMLQLYESDTTASAPTTGERFLMIESRNATWAEKLPELMRKQPCFIAVGALHLPGKYGLIELLRKKGYKVKAVQ